MEVIFAGNWKTLFVVLFGTAATILWWWKQRTNISKKTIKPVKIPEEVNKRMSSKVLRTIGASKPIRMWIDGKCYNLKQFKRKSAPFKTSSKGSPSEKDKEMVTISEAAVGSTNTSGINVSDFIKDTSGRVSTSFVLPSIYYIRLNQVSNIDIAALSRSTQTEIFIPKHGKAGKLVITGESSENVKNALEEIHSVLGNLRDQARAMQFIAIPLLSEEIQKNFEKFKEEILSDKDSIKGMEESIFQSKQKLHLTILVCVLHDEREKQEAINALQDYKNEILGPLLEKSGPLYIQVSGVECMTDDYKKANVIYSNAKIIDENEDVNLQKIADSLSDFFYERGLLKRYQETVKLHMTLINTKYRKTADSPKRSVKRQSIDATKLIEKYKDYHFGISRLENIRLSLISSKGDDGFYKTLSSIEVK